MSEPNADLLDRLADAICDDTPVDWDAEVRADARFAKRIEQLRDLHSIAQVYQQIALAADGAAPTKSDTWTLPRQAPAVSTVKSAADGMPSTWGPLCVQERIDRGGFGEVYRAYDPSLQREVALKLLRPSRAGVEATRRLLEEARRLARVRHPNVLLVYGAAEHDGRAGIWAELVRGESLQELVAVRGPLGSHEATLIGIELCQALAALHGAGLVHRDVKAANVMREQGGRIVLMDFGSAIEQTQSDPFPGLEGTPFAMAPELLLSRAQPSPASDFYSLGVLLYWLVSGRHPIEALDFAQLCDKHRHGGALPLRDVRADLPTAFVQVVERALEPDPKRRYTSAGEMERALARTSPLIPAPAPGPVPPDSVVRNVREGAEVHRAEPPPGTTRRRRPRVRRIVWTLAAVALVAAGVGRVAPRFLPLRVDVSLHRQGQGTTELLAPGSQTRPGDRIFLEIAGSRPMYVYVTDEDEQGQVFTLFPDAAGLHNPLAPRVRHRLPTGASGEAASWEVTTRGGTETILVLVATEPRADIESELQRYPRPVEGLGKPRGLGRVVPEARAESVTQRLERLARAQERALRIWKIQVHNVGE